MASPTQAMVTQDVGTVRGYQSTLDDYAAHTRKAASRIWDGDEGVVAAPFALKFSLNERNAVMKRTMPLTSWLGFGLLAAIILGMLWRHGREWEFSCHGIPVSHCRRTVRPSRWQRDRPPRASDYSPRRRGSDLGESLWLSVPCSDVSRL